MERRFDTKDIRKIKGLIDRMRVGVTDLIEEIVVQMEITSTMKMELREAQQTAAEMYVTRHEHGKTNRQIADES